MVAPVRPQGPSGPSRGGPMNSAWSLAELDAVGQAALVRAGDVSAS